MRCAPKPGPRRPGPRAASGDRTPDRPRRARRNGGLWTTGVKAPQGAAPAGRLTLPVSPDHPGRGSTGRSGTTARFGSMPSFRPLVASYGRRYFGGSFEQKKVLDEETVAPVASRTVQVAVEEKPVVQLPSTKSSP